MEKTPRRVARSLDHQLLLTSVATILLFLVFIVLDFHLALDVFPNDQDSTAAQGSFIVQEALLFGLQGDSPYHVGPNLPLTSEQKSSFCMRPMY